MGLRTEILRELFDPVLHAKRAAIDGLRPIIEARALRSPSWWAWTVWLTYGITVKRIESA
jgi:hypothetical protein